MSATATAELGRRDYQILSVICVGHFMSHFYLMALPPLFLFLVNDFKVLYAELGLVLALNAITTAIVQVPIGFATDRLGGRKVLLGGLVGISVFTGLIGLAPSFWVVYLLAILAGLANSVFHPADYAILNSSITPARMGRAFSIHTFAGHMGTALAPATMILLASWAGWRMALVAVGLFGLIAALAVASQWHVMREDKAEAAKTRKAKADAAETATDIKTGIALLLSLPMVTFFLFYTTLSMTSAGMQAFAATALVNLHGLSLGAANVALSVFLFCSAAGILIGGEIADRTQRHDIVAAIVFVLTAVCCAILAMFHPQVALLLAIMAAMGIGQGITRPARDMMLRAAAPKGSAGKLFGFVSAGIALGSALAPIPFGYLIDIGKPEWVFYLLAILFVVALVTVMTPKTVTSEARAGPAKA